MKADAMALGAVVLWASLAPIAIQLSDIPPLLMTAVGLLIGSTLALPLSRFRPLKSWRIPPTTLLIGVVGLFGYHLALFFALQNAPAAEANLVNYLWPVGIVLLTPVLLSGFELERRHLLAAALGFAGAALAILSSQAPHTGMAATSWPNAAFGFLAALCAAAIWAAYSVLTKGRPRFETAAVGLFALISGMLALCLHVFLESPYSWQQQDFVWLALLGFGPLGLAFYLWDAALKLGNPIRIGIISFLTPLLSTLGVLLVQQRPVTPAIAAAALLIMGSGAIGLAARASQITKGRAE